MAPWQHGVTRIEAFFSGEAYAPHRHDTYSIGYTIQGVQSFDYRGARSDSTAGQVIVLHPDEVHTGEAGTEDGFHYRMIYVEPSIVRDALGARAATLPFVKNAVFEDRRLLHAIHVACGNMDHVLEPTALDDVAVLLADGLLANNASVHRPASALIDWRALDRARAYLDANFNRTVTSDELERITGQDRFALARQFRGAYGTSPYRYLLMRRLDRARADIAAGLSLADAAVAAGFSDQSHMTRRFKATYGLAPGQWQRLVARGDRVRTESLK